MCMCMCVCVCVCVYMRMCVYPHVCLYVSVRACGYDDESAHTRELNKGVELHCYTATLNSSSKQQW